MSTRTPKVPDQPRPRPSRDLGFAVRTQRQAQQLTHEQLSHRTGIRPPQISILETGHNVESVQYAIIARALGFRGALELFRARDTDPLRTKLDRVWRQLDEPEKRRALAWLAKLVID